MTLQTKPLRGGSCNLFPRHCRSAYRNHGGPDGAYNDVGFRVVCLSDQKKDAAVFKPLRGGAWLSFPRGCRSASRDRYQPGIALIYFGFRVVCLSDQKKEVFLKMTLQTKPLRGGSWDSNPKCCRSAYRHPIRPGHAFDDVGFRVVCLPSLTTICQNDDLLQ